MYEHLITVFCKNQDEVNAAIQHWANVQGYEIINLVQSSAEADHFVMTETGEWTNCESARFGETTTILFGG